MQQPMSVTDYIASIFGRDTAAKSPNELEQLRTLLDRREKKLNLTAEYGRPHPNTRSEPTVVFPYTLYAGDEEYGAGAKEFALPDNGLADTDAPLTKFIGKRHSIGPDEVDFEALASVEGTTAEAELTDEGDVIVGAQRIAESEVAE